MSAYGEIRRGSTSSISILPSTLWGSKSHGSDSDGRITVHHLTLSTSRQLPGLLDYLNKIFASEIKNGQTYPQEGEMGQPTFEAYFFAADVFVGIFGGLLSKECMTEGGDAKMDIDDARATRSWEECVAGYYYIKPNYPGRSSHICNAGFVVPPERRGNGYGFRLAKSFLHYAPLLGYRASIFNLVYVNNTASVRIWERLNFIKVGRIPEAGRVQGKDGNEDEYVDALVFYKGFVV